PTGLLDALRLEDVEGKVSPGHAVAVVLLEQGGRSVVLRGPTAIVLEDDVGVSHGVDPYWVNLAAREFPPAVRDHTGFRVLEPPRIIDRAQVHHRVEELCAGRGLLPRHVQLIRRSAGQESSAGVPHGQCPDDRERIEPGNPGKRIICLYRYNHTL